MATKRNRCVSSVHHCSWGVEMTTTLRWRLLSGIDFFFISLPLALREVSLGATPRDDDDARMPRFKWAQTLDKLFITVVIKDLDKESVEIYAPDEGTVIFRANENLNGDAFYLNLTFWEDLKPETLHWSHLARREKFGNGVLITVNKATEHRWSQLSPNMAKYKKAIEKDWTREDTALDVEQEPQYIDGHEKYVEEFTSANLVMTCTIRFHHNFAGVGHLG